MVKVIAKFTIKEDKVEVFKNLVPELITETRKEAGCIGYQLFEDQNDKRVLMFVEEWESMEALQKHMSSKHFTEAIPKLTELQEKDLELNVCNLVI